MLARLLTKRRYAWRRWGRYSVFITSRSPVTYLARSRDWYEEVFDLVPEIEFPDDNGVVRGVAYKPKNDFRLSLRENPEVARATAGFDPFAILVQDKNDVMAWAERLDSLGIEHSPVIAATIGWIVVFRDPDGLELRFYSGAPHDEAEADARVGGVPTGP